MPLQAYPFSPLHLIFLLTDIVDEGSVLFLTYKPLQPLHNGSEQHILGTLYDNRNSAAGLLLQVLGVAV